MKISIIHFMRDFNPVEIDHNPLIEGGLKKNPDIKCTQSRGFLNTRGSSTEGERFLQGRGKVKSGLLVANKKGGRKFT